MTEKLYKLMNWPEIEAVIYSEEDKPHRLLGAHPEGTQTLPGGEGGDILPPEGQKGRNGDGG